MAKIKQIGNKTEILKKKIDRSKKEKFLDDMANMEEDQLNEWFDKHFSGFPGDTRSGFELIIRTLWANARVTREMWLRK